jgi:hypothetical protein
MCRFPWIGLWFALQTIGCIGERVVTTETQQLSGLTVHVRLEASLAAAGQALNWAPGAVPGATVIVQRVDGTEPAPPDTATADSAGNARFSNLPVAKYTVRVARDFTVDEQTRAKSVLGGVYALEGLTAATVDIASGIALDVEARGLDRGTLVISEIFPTALMIGRGQYWYWGNYVEIYNNSDAVVPLAGKLFLQAFHAGIETPNFPCQLYAALTADPAGLWAQLIYQFPDSAEPVQPGRAVVVATDAIDHRQFGQGIGFFDLSHAEYEFRGSEDVDNPVAKDMLDIGPRVIPFGHGWLGGASLRGVVALAQPLSIDTLPTKLSPALGTNYLRIPKGALLDVLQWNTPYQTTYPNCPPSVASEIDAGEPRLISAEDSVSMHRRVRYTLPDGRAVLQRSRNSAADFLAAPGTPGKVP